MNTLKTGFEVIFITPQSRRHEGEYVTDAVIEQAEALGIKSVTKRTDMEGTGLSGHTHAAHFFELADQPVELMYVVDGDTADRLIRAVSDAGIYVFCLRRPVEYGQLGTK